MNRKALVKMQSMKIRSIMFAMTALCLSTSGAVASEDVEVLRGSYGYAVRPPVFMRWDGVYGGVQAGVASANMNFGNATSDLVAFILRNSILENEARVSQWTTMPEKSTNHNTYGGFLGYNVQWEDVVLGVELNYNRGTLRATASDTITRSFTTSDGYFYNTDVTASSSLAIRDYLTTRLRAGWVYGTLLPYATAGFAVGRADITNSATVTSVGTKPANPVLTLGPTTLTETKENTFIYGFSLGGGVDWAILPNLFLRAEYEFVRFLSPTSVDVSMHNGRIAAGLKF